MGCGLGSLPQKSWSLSCKLQPEPSITGLGLFRILLRDEVVQSTHSGRGWDGQHVAVSAWNTQFGQVCDQWVTGASSKLLAGV